eukprot:gene25029-33539_t
MELLSTPGFGWASKRKAAKERVALFSESKLLKEGDFCFEEGRIIFASLSPGELLCASYGEIITPFNPVKTLPLPKREFAIGDNSGPDLSALNAEQSFVYRKVSAAVEENSEGDRLTSSFIFNEKGSVHISFTREEEALLLVLWSGSHAAVFT